MTSAEFSPDFVRQVTVLLVRQRIESVATASLCVLENRPTDDRPHAQIRSRLLTLLVDVSEERWWAVYQIVDRAAAVYKQACDVLHGRVAFADVPRSLVDEWRATTDDLEELYRTWRFAR